MAGRRSGCRSWPPTMCASSGPRSSSPTRRACASTTGRSWPIPGAFAATHSQQYLRTPAGDGKRSLPTFPRPWRTRLRSRAAAAYTQARPGAPAAVPSAGRGNTTEGFLRTEAAARTHHSLRDTRASHTRQGDAARLQSELEVICQMGFAGYFLIVADFIRWARQQRGAGGARARLGCRLPGRLQPGDHRSRTRSRYDLLFERFLNPERVSMPDFDIDFCMDGPRPRHRVRGRRSTGASASRRSSPTAPWRQKPWCAIGRVLGMTYGYVDRIAKLIPLRARHHARCSAREGAGAASASMRPRTR